MQDEIKKQLQTIPNASGCYRFYDKTGEIIYIGKAKSLKRRVTSYFQKHHDSAKLQVMVPQIVKIECVIVNSEIEALILESQLIKKYKPKYNVLLKDDKKFPYLVMTNEEYPRIIVVRKANKNMVKGKYFGPYTDARAMHSTLEILQKIFPLKKCTRPKFNSRPCIYYDMGQCAAPCQRLITPSDYRKILKNVELFLNGKQTELVKILEKRMYRYSERQEFEKARNMRDAISDIQKTMEQQRIVSENIKTSEDYICVSKSENTYCACIVEIREGRLIGKKDFEFQKFSYTSEDEITDAIMREYYTNAPDENLPKRIYVDNLPLDCSLYENWLTLRAKHKVEIKAPYTKNQKGIMEIARKNVENQVLRAQVQELVEIQNNYNEVGSYLMEKLNLRHFPHTIECYDISHIQGTNTVASGVCFHQGEPKKSKYRRYKLKTIANGEVDDFKSMKEILQRRFKRIKEGETAPDLIIIDGGKGQLSSVLTVMKEMDIDLDICSLAKREEEIFLPNQKNPIIIPLNSPALHLLERLRDEAHRFAITYHRKLRGKEIR